MKTVLVVDDAPHGGRAVELRLKAGGYHVLSARDGATGLVLAVDCRPDLILLDVCLPMLSGFEVAKALRERQVKIPIIFMTASRKEGLWETAQALGAVGFIEKPYDATELLESVKRWTWDAGLCAKCPIEPIDGASGSLREKPASFKSGQSVTRPI